MSSAAAVETQVDPLVLDETTRHRLLVAEATAETLEGLAEARTWRDLDPALGAHLLAQSSRLRVYLAALRGSAALSAHEDERLALRRLERRLEITQELLAPRTTGDADPNSPAAGEGSAAGQLFLGDFTNAEASRDTVRVERPRRAVSAPKRHIARLRGAASELSVGRLVMWGCVAVAICLGSVLARMATTDPPKATERTAPMLPVIPMAHVDDLKDFLPVETTETVNGTLLCIVDRSWLKKGEPTRRHDADAAAVFLANRNVTRFRIAFADGTMLYRTDGQTTDWSADGHGLGRDLPPPPPQ